MLFLRFLHIYVTLQPTPPAPPPHSQAGKESFEQHDYAMAVTRFVQITNVLEDVAAVDANVDENEAIATVPLRLASRCLASSHLAPCALMPPFAMRAVQHHCCHLNMSLVANTHALFILCSTPHPFAS
jgi:hypothetical protein